MTDHQGNDYITDAQAANLRASFASGELLTWDHDEIESVVMPLLVEREELRSLVREALHPKSFHWDKWSARARAALGGEAP